MKNSKRLKMGIITEVTEGEREFITFPEKVLQKISGDNPGIWKMAEEARERRAVMGVKNWPTECFIPASVCLASLAHIHSDRMSLDQAVVALGAEARLVAALAAWRMTKGVYRFHPEMLKALMESELSEDAPMNLLLRLPDWCVYVPTPGVEFMEKIPMWGFFAYIDSDSAQANGQKELCISVMMNVRDADEKMRNWMIGQDRKAMADVVKKMANHLRNGGSAEDYDIENWTALFPKDALFLPGSLRIPLGDQSFKEAAERVLRERRLMVATAEKVFREDPARDVEARLARSDALQHGRLLDDVRADDMEAGLAGMVDIQLKLAGLLLYLCAEEPDLDIEDAARRGTELKEKMQKGKRCYPADRISMWDVGFRIGSSIGAAREARRLAEERGEGGGRSPMPHVRRAHWHTFLVGPRSETQARRVKWLPPIPVLVESPDSLVPTIHRVQA